MNAIVISDAHIGSRFFLSDLFMKFVGNLPPDTTLILNGDTVDQWHKGLSAADEEALDLLRRESRRRRVVWVYGNHDDTFTLIDPERIEFCKEYSIGLRLFITHGYDFDNVMPYHRTFLRMFRALHHLRIWLGAEAVHVAHYAKKWGFLYRILRRNVSMNAIEHAREKGYAAVTCGHTHFVEDVTVGGIRYINTGSWTEMPVCYVWIDDGSISLRRVDPAHPELFVPPAS